MAFESFPQPHWLQEHKQENRGPVLLVVLMVIGLQFFIPKSLAIPHHKVFCFVEAMLLVLIVLIAPKKLGLPHIPQRTLTLVLNGFMMLSNAASAILLVGKIVDGSITSPTRLLWSGFSIWLSNIVIFSLWYWDFDRGGPSARAAATDSVPDFLFPQMTDPAYAAPGWFPRYSDYLYVSVTNASAFSPTDAMPLTKWAKLLMAIQSITSLVLVGLVVARAVNILH
ncbi:MAG: hypothetical protein WCP64_06410 [Actinomycetes bacterium]